MTHQEEKPATEKKTIDMQNKSRTNSPIKQAYNQAPWRIATQRGVLFLIIAILASSILWIMVNVTIQAAAAGLEIQQLEEKREALQRQIASRRTDIARQTTSAVMKERALKLGFEPIDPENVTYIVVPGYKGRQPIIQALPSSQADQPPIIKPVYTQSLSEWILQGIMELGESPVQLLPPGRANP